MKLLVAIVLGLGLLAAFTLWRAARHEARAETAFPPEGRIVQVDGHRVHAVVMEPDDAAAPDLVLIHGASGNLRDFTFALVPMLARHYRVIAFDRPGLGHTERIRGKVATIDRQAALLQRAAAQLGAERPLVLGHSYGGAVALAWAVRHPQALSGLVTLSAASHPWETGLSTYYRLLSHPLLGPLVTPLLTAYVPDARVEDAVAEVFAPDPVPKGYLAHFGAGLTLRRQSLRANAMQRASLLAEIEALAPLYHRIDVPTEIVHGTADTTAGVAIHSQPLARAVAGANLTRLPGTGHMPHHAKPNAVAAAVHRAAARAGLR